MIEKHQTLIKVLEGALEALDKANKMKDEDGPARTWNLNRVIITIKYVQTELQAS